MTTTIKLTNINKVIRESLGQAGLRIFTGELASKEINNTITHTLEFDIHTYNRLPHLNRTPISRIRVTYIEQQDNSVEVALQYPTLIQDTDKKECYTISDYIAETLNALLDAHINLSSSPNSVIKDITTAINLNSVTNNLGANTIDVEPTGFSFVK